MFKKLIGKFKFKKDCYVVDKNENHQIGDSIYIWGIKSGDDLTDYDAGFFTMTDFDIIYDGKTNTYSMGVETIWGFEDKQAEKNYIKGIYEKLTAWMISNEYNTDKELNCDDVFCEGFNIRTKFKLIEDLYSTFKFLAKGFGVEV